MFATRFELSFVLVMPVNSGRSFDDETDIDISMIDEYFMLQKHRASQIDT